MSQLLKARQAAGTVAAEPSGTCSSQPWPWVFHGRAAEHHKCQSCASWARLQWSGQMFYSLFLPWCLDRLCCLLFLDLHVDPWQTQKVVTSTGCQQGCHPNSDTWLPFLPPPGPLKEPVSMMALLGACPAFVFWEARVRLLIQEVLTTVTTNTHGSFLQG